MSTSHPNDPIPPLRPPTGGATPPTGFNVGTGDTPFRSRPFVLEDLVKQTLDDRYVIDELIGMGGMGAVFRARQTRLRRTVALKVPKPELCKNAEFLARFEREALTMAKLVHQNIVQIFDVSVSPIIAVPSFIVMEFVEGTELDKFLFQQERDLTIEAVLDLFLQIGDGLDAAHHRGIVHRDIKPANIVVTMPQRVAKIMDFGIAKQASMDNAFQTMEAQAIGTPAFMAPEQIEGKTVTPAADIYAFAIMIYRLLTRQSPFQATSVSALMMAHITEPPAPISAMLPSLPAALDAALQKGLEKAPEKRWSSAGELAIAVARALEPVRSKCFADLFGPLDAGEAVARATARTQAETGAGPAPRDPIIAPSNPTPTPSPTGQSAAARKARLTGDTSKVSPPTHAPATAPSATQREGKSSHALVLVLLGVGAAAVLLASAALGGVLYYNYSGKKPAPPTNSTTVAGTTTTTTTTTPVVVEATPTPLPQPTQAPTPPPAAAIADPTPVPPTPAPPTPAPTQAPAVVIVQVQPTPTPIVIYVTPTPGPEPTRVEVAVATSSTPPPATPPPASTPVASTTTAAPTGARPVIDTDPRWMPASTPTLTDAARIKRLKREATNYFGDRIQRPLYNGLIDTANNDLALGGEDARTLMHRVNDLRARAQNVSLQLDIRDESLFWENQMELVIDWKVSGTRTLRSTNESVELLKSRTPLVMRLERSGGAQWRMIALKGEIPRAGQ